MLIYVTKADIAAGKPRECRYCPVAMAIKRTTRRRNVHVTGAYANFGGRTYDLPEKAMEFIQDFDSNSDVRPFRFSLSEVVPR